MTVPPVTNGYRGGNLYARVREPRETFGCMNITTEEVIDHLFTKRIRNNQNVIGAVCGETGSGKSWTALKIGEMVSPNFSIDSVAFSTKEFLECFDSHSPGDLIVFDEGQEFGARRSMSKKNVEMSDILTMLRFTQVNVLFTVPNIRQVDISLRRLMHLYLDVRTVDRVSGPRALRNRSVATIYQIRHRRDPGTGGDELRRMFPEIPIERNGMIHTIKVDSAQFRAPSADLVALYEAKKRRVFHDRLHLAIRNVSGAGAPPAPPAPTPPGASDLSGLM